MKSSRNQLILLGMICQGLSWDDWLLPGISLGLWLVALGAVRRPVHLGSANSCQEEHGR